MEVIIRPLASDAVQLTARLIAREIRSRLSIVLGLATGRTMEEVYEYLAMFHKKGGLSFSHCTTFNLDEYIGLPASDENSYRYYMNKHLFNNVDIDLARTHLPNGCAPDVKVECRNYESLIASYGGIDLQLLGLGVAGHIGFNEPLSSLRSRTRDKGLTPETINQNAVLFGGDSSRVPRRALTMGVGTILEAKQILLLVTGREKAAILAKAVEGPITSMISATALQLHPSCRVICDEEAALELGGKDYYRWIFENEPEWREFRQ